MPIAPQKSSVIQKALSGWPIPAFVILLASLPCDKALADEPASTIDFSPVAKYITRDNLQPEQDQPMGHIGATSSASGQVGIPVIKGFDSPSSSPKWNEPAKVEEIPSVDGKKHFLITTPLPVPFCVINKINGSSNQSRQFCENAKF